MSGDVFTIGYDGNDRLKTITSSLFTKTNNYSSGNLLKSIGYAKSGTTLNTFNYTHDPAGFIKSISATGLSSNYQYDLKDQLTGVTSTEGNESFVYDFLGNRTQDQVGSYVYDANKQRLTEDYKYIYNYDNNGNLISKQEKGFSGNFTNYTYNSLNRMTRVEIYVDGAKVKDAQYYYDVLGRRIQKVVSDGVTTKVRKYEYDGEEIIAVYNSSNAIIGKYSPSYLRTDDMLAVEYASGKYSFVKDALGTIHEIRNSSGQIVQKYHYSSFGVLNKITDGSGNEITSAPVIEVHFAYTGREFDEESGLYYYRARYYDAKVGRFLGEDPDGGNLKDPRTFVTRYAYALNNPVVNIDPNGEFSFGAFSGFAFSGNFAGAFDHSVRGIVEFDRFANNFIGTDSTYDLHVRILTSNLVQLKMSEEDEVRLTKVAIIVAIIALSGNAGVLSAGEVGGITAISGYEALGEDGNYVDNFLNYEGANLITGAMSKMVVGKISNPVFKKAAEYIGVASLLYSTGSSTIKIKKKYLPRM